MFITIEAEDGLGGVCTGGVTVCVPHDKQAGAECLDDGKADGSFGP